MIDAEGDFVVTYDEQVGWYSFEPQTPEADAWLLERRGGVRGPVDGLNAEGARYWARRARDDAFTVDDRAVD